MRFLLILFAVVLFAENTTTRHTIELVDGPLSYTATVGSIGQISYIAYVKEGGISQRPITFAFNGGPGSSSVMLHIGAFGPRRIVSPEEGQAAIPPYQIVDNFETLLDVSDLVFVDPAGTGLSESKEEVYGMMSDIHSIGDFIRDFITQNKRWNAPKYLAGESYGTLRACGLANYLQQEYGIYLNGLILISCAIDYQTILFEKDNLLPYLLYLPTYATTAWHYGRYMPGSTLEEAANLARLYIYKTYASSLLRRNYHEKEQLYAELAEMTGLPSHLVRKAHGQIGNNLFLLEFFGPENKVLGGYDTRVSGYYTHPGLTDFFQDPSSTAIEGILSGGFHDYLQRELSTPISYRIMSMDVHTKWDFQKSTTLGYPNMMGELRSAIAVNPCLKVFVGSGYFDAVTPFAAAEYCFDHLEMPGASVQMEYYEGGHMYYLNPAARQKFKRDLIRFYGN